MDSKGTIKPPNFDDDAPPYLGPSHQGYPEKSQHSQIQQEPFNYNGIYYDIKHRSTNTTLEVHLQQNQTIKSIPSAMVRMSASASIKGRISFSFRKMLTGNRMDEVTYGGPGIVVVAPTLMGDIVSVPIDGSAQWLASRHALLAWTEGVTRDTKSQGFSQSLLGGNGVFVYTFAGEGMLWLRAFGAIDTIDVSGSFPFTFHNWHFPLLLSD